MPIEIERKFTLPDGKRITGLGDELRLGERRVESLRAVYFDTPDFTLARNKITLRRRTGGHDAGWHLKLPGDGTMNNEHARREIHSPIRRGQSLLQVPADLRERVADLIGYEPLQPVVDLATRRVETDITTPRGRVLAALADDHVTATRLGRKQTWRELEVELTGGDVADLDRITAALTAVGATPKDAPSKLVQALGDDLGKRRKLKKSAPAAAVLAAYIADQVGIIQGREAEVRADAPDAVHKMRVATRRLRSTLRTFRDLLDAERTEPLRDELKWLAEKLGAPRDAEVLKAHLLADLAALPPELIHGPIERRMRAELDAGHDRAHRELLAALDSRRARVLLDNLVRLLSEPPYLDPEAPGPKALRKELAAARKRVTARWAKAVEAEDAEREQWSHETRKKAKAARYGWEAATPSFADGDEVAAAWEDVTEVLGQAQDTVVARARLLELAAAAQRAKEPTFTYGVLWERQREREAAAFDDAHSSVKQAVKKAKQA